MCWLPGTVYDSSSYLTEIIYQAWTLLITQETNRQSKCLLKWYWNCGRCLNCKQCYLSCELITLFEAAKPCFSGGERGKLPHKSVLSGLWFKYNVHCLGQKYPLKHINKCHMAKAKCHKIQCHITELLLWHINCYIVSYETGFILPIWTHPPLWVNHSHRTWNIVHLGPLGPGRWCPSKSISHAQANTCHFRVIQYIGFVK